MARFQLALALAVAASEDELTDLAEFRYSPLVSPPPSDHSSAASSGSDFSITAALAAALRKSLICTASSAAGGDSDADSDGRCASAAVDVGWPTDVKHVSHVTFDRFSGFLGLPVEFEPEILQRAPSASASVFGVSAKSMQCSYDCCGNSVPTILLAMQGHLYAHGGLQVEGIFRINAENSQELYVRDQLNKGIVPHRVDLHCLAGLIKAWFRELPTGVLDSLTPDQVMHCNTEEECSKLVRMLPSTEATLLDWAINLMADVVENEHHNKMNARNIAMVFAPNMTQMADPLTALIHAVQVMNFLKTLIIMTIREREDAVAADARVFHSCSESPSGEDRPESSNSTETLTNDRARDFGAFDRDAFNRFLIRDEQSLGCDNEETFQGSEGSSMNNGLNPLEGRPKLKYNNVHRLNFREGVRKLCRHSVLQLSKSKKPGELGITSS